VKIAIAGAGLTGAYLYRLFRNQPHEIEIFDVGPETRCSISPCAWGTSRGFAGLVKACGLEPEKYLLRHFDHVRMNDLKIRADLMTFDKPMLIQDLLHGAEILYSPIDPAAYDRIIDATGVARFFLPPIEEDILLPCVQSCIQTQKPLENRIRLGRIGYTWCFPLSENKYHIGCGSLISDPRRILQDLGWIAELASSREMDVICTCRGSIRLTSPHSAQPFVTGGAHGGIWGVGEAIGCVAPLAGDGVVPGMKSVQILMDCWEDPGRYTETLLKEFAWMKEERVVIDKLKASRPLRIRDAWVLKKNSRRMGMEVGLGEAGRLLKSLR
jgi:hypothetical protein